MNQVDFITASCKQCGGDIEFVSRGIAPSGETYKIESPDIPYDVIENVIPKEGTCPHCLASLKFTSSCSAWIEIIHREEN